MRHAAARKIQKRWRELPRNNVTYNFIRDPYHVLWFKNDNRRHFGRYALNTFRQLNKHPETRAPKRRENVLLIPTRGVSRRGVNRPRIFPPTPPRRRVLFRGSFGMRVAGTPSGNANGSPARRSVSANRRGSANRRTTWSSARRSVGRGGTRSRVRRLHTAPRTNANMMINAGFGSPNRN